MSWRCASGSGSPSSGCCRRPPAAASPGWRRRLRLALDVPDDHAIDPRALTAALAAAVRRAGGEVREGAAVAAVVASDGAVRPV